MAKGKRKRRKKKRQTSVETVDLLAVMPSKIALEALLHTGAGTHQDRRKRRRRGRKAWKLDLHSQQQEA